MTAHELAVSAALAVMAGLAALAAIATTGPGYEHAPGPIGHTIEA